MHHQKKRFPIIQMNKVGYGDHLGLYTTGLKTYSDQCVTLKQWIEKTKVICLTGPFLRERKTILLGVLTPGQIDWIFF